MKKLMIAAAALCATVGASAIESANVVGYATPDLGLNANLVAPPFQTVGAAGMDIQQIKPANDALYGGAITLKVLTDVLGDDVEYFYLPSEEAPGGVAGWYLDDYATYVDRTFSVGEGFILVNGLDDSTVTYSGEVSVGKPTWEIAPNANFCGNDSPISLSVQDIKVGTAVDAEGNLTDELDEIYGGAITLKLMTDVLADDVEYFYLPAAEAPGGAAGWYFDDYTTPATDVFAPGEGFILVSGIAAGFAQIPAALTVE